MNIYEQLTDWLKTTYDPMDGEWLYFNALNMDGETNSVLPVSGISTINTFIGGSTENEMVFAIALIRMYDTEMSDTNLNAIKDINDLVIWIKNQTEMPDFGEDYIVNFIEVVQDVPDISVDQDSGLCKYQMQFKINYLTK